MSQCAPVTDAVPPYQRSHARGYYPYPKQPPFGQPPQAQLSYNQGPQRKGNSVANCYPLPPGPHPFANSISPPHRQNSYPQANHQQPPLSHYGHQQLHPSAWQTPIGHPPAQGYQQQWHQQSLQPKASTEMPAYSSNVSPDLAVSPTTTAPPAVDNSPGSQDSQPSNLCRSTRTASLVPSEAPESHQIYQTEAYSIDLGSDGWDYTDSDGAMWPKANEPIDSKLSLGVITWHPPIQLTRALHWDFFTAEERASKPPLPKIGNGNSVSEYFGPDNAHQAFLDVRQTDEWESKAHDPIFQEFPTESDIISLEDVLAHRDRPDPEGESPYPSVQEIYQRGGQQHSYRGVATSPKQPSSSDKSGGGLPRACHADQSQSSYPRDEAQEALLASLGVTGSPKPIKSLPTPAFLPPKPPQVITETANGHDSIFDGHHPNSPRLQQNGYGCSHAHAPLHFPPSSQRPSQTAARTGDWQQISPTRANHGRRTASCADVQMMDNDECNGTGSSPQRPRLARADSTIGIKRSHEETESPKRQQDDCPTRSKRRQPLVAAAYGQVDDNHVRKRRRQHHIHFQSVLNSIDNGCRLWWIQKRELIVFLVLTLLPVFYCL